MPKKRDDDEYLLFRWMRTVVNDPETTTADRHVALTVALHMDKYGKGAYPSIRLLAAEARRNTHTVNTSILHLEALGFLDVKRAKKNGRHGWSPDVNHYRAQLPIRATVQSPVEATGDEDTQWPIQAQGSGLSEQQNSPRVRESAPLGASLSHDDTNDAPDWNS